MHADGLPTEKLPDGKVSRVDHRLGLYLGSHLNLISSHSLGAEVPATGFVPWMGFAVSRRWDESSASSARTTRSGESANKDQEGRGIGRCRGMMRKEPVLGQAASFAGGDDQNLEDSDVDQGYRANSGKRKPRKDIAWKARIARPFGQAAKLNDS